MKNNPYIPLVCTLILVAAAFMIFMEQRRIIPEDPGGAENPVPDRESPFRSNGSQRQGADVVANATTPPLGGEPNATTLIVTGRITGVDCSRTGSISVSCTTGKNSSSKCVADIDGHFRVVVPSPARSLVVTVEGIGIETSTQVKERVEGRGDSWHLGDISISYRTKLPLRLRVDDEAAAMLLQAGLTTVTFVATSVEKRTTRVEGDDIVFQHVFSILSGDSTFVALAPTANVISAKWQLTADGVTKMTIREQYNVQVHDGSYQLEECVVDQSLIIFGRVISDGFGPVQGARVELKGSATRPYVFDSTADGAFVFAIEPGAGGRLTAKFGDLTSGERYAASGGGMIEIQLDTSPNVKILVLKPDGSPLTDYALNRQNRGARPGGAPPNLFPRKDGVAVTKYRRLHNGMRFFVYSREFGDRPIVIDRDVEATNRPIAVTLSSVAHARVDIAVDGGLPNDLVKLTLRESNQANNLPVSYWTLRRDAASLVVSDVVPGEYDLVLDRGGRRSNIKTVAVVSPSTSLAVSLP